MSAAQVLEKRTLVLNRRWQPISVTNVKEALCLVYKGSAKIIEPETYEAHTIRSWVDASRARRLVEGDVVRSPSVSIAAPQVVVLTGYEGLGERSVVFSRKNLFKRDRYTCVYCGAQPGREELTVDHVVPRSRGGVSSWENCVLACLACNKRKGDKTPAEASMKLRKPPKRPTWRIQAEAHPGMRRESWDQFLSRAYWDLELEA